ncbi:MAG: hypothetical protein VX951_11365 [Planctomycetota bacterium]|nr:hypothetical protein [Planctomycetota bacterium]
MKALATLAVSLLIVASFGSPAMSQSSNVRGTGCPGAPYPTVTRARIGQPVTFAFPASMSNTVVPFFVLGWSSGNTQYWGRPLTCVDKCGFYPAPFFITSLPPATRNLTVLVPNDPTLFMTCYSFQTAGADPVKGCVNLHGAVSFCIGR